MSPRPNTKLRAAIGAGVTDGMATLDAKMVQATNIIALSGAVVIGIWAIVALFTGEYINAGQNAFAAVLFGTTLWLNRATRPIAAATLLMATLQMQLMWAVYLFGYHSGSPLFYSIALFGAYLVFPPSHRKRAHVFAALSGALWIASAALQDHLPQRMAMMDVRTQELLNIVFVTGGLFFCAAAYAWVIDDGIEALNHARARADGLLLNVLPPSVAERLKAEPDATIADRFDEVTILFADIVGFTPLSATMPASDMVELLNEIFSTFDDICDEHGAEKIKTIGDGYMAICGAPAERTDHALVMARVAVAMQAYMTGRPAESPLKLRVGLNSGPAVAAIVGRSRFHWDVWGDPVNVAARMESTGQAGRVHLTKATWEKIRDEFECEPRGPIEVKGKGKMETWFVSADHGK